MGKHLEGGPEVEGGGVRFRVSPETSKSFVCARPPLSVK